MSTGPVLTFWISTHSRPVARLTGELCERVCWLRLEHAVSCGGGLRAWLRLNVLVMMRLTRSGCGRGAGADLAGGVIRDDDRLPSAGVREPVLYGCWPDCHGGRCAGVWVCAEDALAGTPGKQVAQFQGKALVRCVVLPPWGNRSLDHCETSMVTPILIWDYSN